MLGFLKGNIEIKLDSYNVAPGKKLRGIVLLTVKKPVEARELSIRLKAQREVSHSDGNRTTQHETIYDFSQPLDGSKTYDSGKGALEYPFEVTIPGGTQTSVPEVGSAIGQLVGLAAQFAGMGATAKWHLTARLDVKGFDIKKKVKVNVA